MLTRAGHSAEKSATDILVSIHGRLNEGSGLDPSSHNWPDARQRQWKRMKLLQVYAGYERLYSSGFSAAMGRERKITALTTYANSSSQTVIRDTVRMVNGIFLRCDSAITPVE